MVVSLHSTKASLHTDAPLCKFANGKNIHQMTVTQFTIKIMKKSRIILLDNMIVKIDKILYKNGLKRIWVRNFYSYILWILEAKTVDLGCRTLEDTEALAAEIKVIIRQSGWRRIFWDPPKRMICPLKPRRVVGFVGPFPIGYI